MRITIMIISLVFLTSCATIKPPRPWTKNEKIGAAFFVAGHLADTYTTIQHQNYPEIYEINPALGKHPSDSKVYMYMGATGAIGLLIAHYFPNLRLPICIGYGGLGFYMAWGNYKLIKKVKKERR